VLEDSNDKNEQRVKEFKKGYGNLEALLAFIKLIVHTMMPEADHSYDISGEFSEESGEANFKFKFKDDRYVGLLIGKKMRNILMLKTWLLSQQIFILGRAKKISIIIEKNDGEVKSFSN
jgi:hypothetical protein